MPIFYNAHAETEGLLLHWKIMCIEDGKAINSKLADFLVSAFRALEEQNYNVVTFLCSTADFGKRSLDCFSIDPKQCTRFLRILLSTIYPSLGGDGLKVRTDKVRSYNHPGLFYLHTFYWNYLDYGDSSNARLTVGLDYDILRSVGSTSSRNYQESYNFTIHANAAWRKDRKADLSFGAKFVQEKLAQTLVMAKHPRLGASSACHLKLTPDDIIQTIVRLCL